MIYISILAIFISVLSCNIASYRTVKQVKPVNRNRYYNPDKDKRKKRVKYVKKKELKRSKMVKPPKKKKPKRKKKEEVESDSLNIENLEEGQEVTNEPDSTGQF